MKNRMTTTDDRIVEVSICWFRNESGFVIFTWATKDDGYTWTKSDGTFIDQRRWAFINAKGD